MTTDISLVRSCLRGDVQAFEEIVIRYQALVCAITYSAVGNRDVSEELAQETFVQAWSKLAQLKKADKFGPWLCSIARNIVCNHFRDQKKTPAVQYDMAQMEADRDGQSPPETLIRQEEEAMLRDALKQIPQEYREPLVLFYRQNQSTQEVAEAMGLTEAAVRTRLHRARQMLREEVESRIESTLRNTAPGAAFTRSVIGVVGVGLAAGVAGTAAAAGAGNTAGGVLAGVQAKVIAAAAVAVVGTGALVTYHHYSHPEPTDTAVVELEENPWAPQRTVPLRPERAALSSEHIVSIEASEAASESRVEDFQVRSETDERVAADDFDAWFESLMTEYAARNNSVSQTPEAAPPTGVRTRVAGGSAGEGMMGGGMMGGMGGGMMGGMGGYRIETVKDGEMILPEDVSEEAEDGEP